MEDVKILIARQVGIKDHNRIGLFDDPASSSAKAKTLKNRKATIASEEAIMKTGVLQVKDLGICPISIYLYQHANMQPGPQIAWKTVFIYEYLGPILAHLAVLSLRPYIYKNGDSPLSTTQWLSFGMIIAHFLKREYETLFVHKFSANTMPVFNLVKNFSFYCGLSGFLAAYDIYSPASLAARADNSALDVLGFVLFAYGEVSNAIVHLNLASLRTRGGTERKIPTGYGFGLVTCPNYMFEVLSWIGIIITSRSWGVTAFIVVGIIQMTAWAQSKERAYRKEFPDTYKKKRYVILPGLL